MIVHGDDGLDELTTTSTVHRVGAGRRGHSHLDPRSHRPRPGAGAAAEQLVGGDAATNAGLARAVLAGERGRPPRRRRAQRRRRPAGRGSGGLDGRGRGPGRRRARRRAGRRHPRPPASRACTRCRCASAGRRGAASVVRVPASSANLGPGFDALGMALSLHLDVGFWREGDVHPIALAGPSHRARLPLGRRDRARCGCSRPSRWVGGSASRARRGSAGLVAAHVQRCGPELKLAEVAGEILARATELEGHADNVAASLHGGVVATAAGRAVRVPLAFEPGGGGVGAVVHDVDRPVAHRPRSAGGLRRRRVQHRPHRAAGGGAGCGRHRGAAHRHRGPAAPGRPLRPLAAVAPRAHGGAATPGRGAAGCRARGRPWRCCATRPTPSVSPAPTRKGRR